MSTKGIVFTAISASIAAISISCLVVTLCIESNRRKKIRG
jgi:hypothetical protein